MTIQPKTPSKFITAIDTIVLAFGITVVAGRCQISEAFPIWKPFAPPQQATISTGQVSTMLIFTGLIAIALLIWLLAHTIHHTRRHIPLPWRKTSLLVPLALMLIATLLSTSVASNKHTAIIASLNIISQVILAVLLIQLLNSPLKQRLLICAIAASAAVMAYRCFEQARYELPALIEQHRLDPDAALIDQDIEPDTYGAQQFLQRIESRDIGGFFAISNTAAAFFILTITGTLALLLNSAGNISKQRTPLLIVVGIAILLIQLAGLAITKSKGGIAACVIALLLLAVFWSARGILTRHWKLTIATVSIVIIAVITTIVVGGLQHNRLPTASMWVRWQYWHATASMIADHPITGVGIENFGQYYPRYMDPAAPETVKDPHCFILSLWSQWGLLGIVAVIYAIYTITVRLLRPTPLAEPDPNTNTKHNSTNKPNIPTAKSTIPWLWPLVFIVGILIIRLATTQLANTTEIVRLSIYLVSFAVPAAIWLGVFCALLAATKPDRIQLAHPPKRNKFHKAAILTLACGLLGFLLHNSIDFAIFHPAVGTVLLATVAAMLSMHMQNRPNTTIQFPVIYLRLITPIIAIIVVALWATIIVPFIRCQNQLTQAQKLATRGSLIQAAAAAQAAAQINILDPDPSTLAAQYYLLAAQYQRLKQPQTFRNAIAAFKQAINRDPQRTGPYRQLVQLYRQAAAEAVPTKRNDYLNSAYNYSAKALELSPGNSEVLVNHATLLVEIGNGRQATKYFKAALEIEQQFQNNYRQLYPNRKVTPRLKPELQKIAKKHLANIITDK